MVEVCPWAEVRSTAQCMACDPVGPADRPTRTPLIVDSTTYLLIPTHTQNTDVEDVQGPRLEPVHAEREHAQMYIF